MESPSPQSYKLLARYYDEFFTFHREGYRRARRALLGRIFPKISAVCELACGTAATTLELAQLGIKVYGIDVSPAMVRLARAKVRRARARVTIARGDMRTFRLPEPVDLVTCEFDSVNHLPRKSDLARTARAVARALLPGGHFYFDVNNRRAFQKIWPGTSSSEKPGAIMVMKGSYDRHRDRGLADVDWFVRQKNGWRRFHEHVEEVCWTREEIVEALRSAGFRRIRAMDARRFFRDNPRNRPGCRTFYLAQK